MDLDTLLLPIDEEHRSGEDLEYDQAFMDMGIAAQHGEERQKGDEILEAEEPDYKALKEKALEVMNRSHDLRAGVYLAEAELRLRGLDGFAEATSYLNRCLNEYWDTCHPQLDEDDDNDPTMRINAIYMLADPVRIIRGLRRTPLTDSRTFGKLSLREAEIASGKIEAPADMEDVPDAGRIAAAFKDTHTDTLEAMLASASAALDDVRAISEKFDSETPGQGPEYVSAEAGGGYRRLIETLEQINNQLLQATGGDVEVAEEAGEETEDGGAPAAAAPAAGGGVGQINSPADVQKALDRIISYYERHEPSSPIPVILIRAKKLVSADFLTIVRDMAPAGLEHVQLVGGIEDEDY